MTREQIQEQLSVARALAKHPATVFCVQPFASVENDGGKRLGRLLARVMRDPDRSLLIATREAFVFGFGAQAERENQSKTNDPVARVKEP